jgi:hypothetical protein
MMVKSSFAVAAVVVVLALATILAISGLYGGMDANSTPVIVSVLALIGSTIPTLLNLAKTEQVHQQAINAKVTADEVKVELQKTNGAISERLDSLEEKRNK